MTEAEEIKMLRQALCVAREALRAPINDWKGDCERLALSVINDVLAATVPTTEPQKPVNDGWIPWEGGECPIKNIPTAEVKYRNGDKATDKPNNFQWDDEGLSHDIIAYRIVN